MVYRYACTVEPIANWYFLSVNNLYHISWNFATYFPSIHWRIDREVNLSVLVEIVVLLISLSPRRFEKLRYFQADNLLCISEFV